MAYLSLSLVAHRGRLGLTHSGVARDTRELMLCSAVQPARCTRRSSGWCCIAAVAADHALKRTVELTVLVNDASAMQPLTWTGKIVSA